MVHQLLDGDPSAEDFPRNARRTLAYVLDDGVGTLYIFGTAHPLVGNVCYESV